MNKKNEMVYWLIFIVVLLCISFYIIFYFRGNRNLKVYDENNVDSSQEIVVEFE